MNVKFQGFELNVEGGGITWTDFLANLASSSGTEIRYSPFNRILGVNLTENQNYILGLFVSIKNQKRFTEIRENRGQFELVSKDLDAGARLADFNFFILNKQNRRGIYQYYHQSCSLQQFLGFTSSQFYKLKRDKIDELRENETYSEEELLQRLESLKTSRLNTDVMVRSDTFEQLLDQIDQIKEMKFSLSTYEPDTGWFRPLRDCAKKRTERILFNRDMNSAIRTGIRQVIQNEEIEDVRVTGVSVETGIETTIKLFNNINDFGQYDYDNLTEHMVVDLESFHNSEIITLLLHTAQENDQVF